MEVELPFHMPATVLPPEPAAPEVIHSCPNCSHWLPDGTLACPDCQTLTYSNHLSTLAAEAQALEQQGQWQQARDRWRSALLFLPPETRQAVSIQQHIAQIDSRLKAEEDNRAKWTKRLGPLAPIVFFLLKVKSAIFFLFKLKFFLGIFTFFGLYWALFGWKFALGFTVAIFIHEMGHFVMVKRLGLKAELPIFLPGLGAYVRWYNTGVPLADLAAIALAGPAFGLGSSLLCLAIATFTHAALWMVLANVTAWLNLFNLIPVFWFDGAQATYALSRIQRGMITITCLLFFALTAVDGLFSPRTQWVFMFVGAGMAWRCFTNDEPQNAGTRTFAWFQILIIALGLLLVLTPVGGLR
jgi:Zn-dependent protease